MTGKSEDSHEDGEIYAAAMWRVKELYEEVGLDRIKDVLVDWFGGLRCTAADPTFEDARNGMLTFVRVSHKPDDAAQRTCLIWRAFAKFGIGLGSHISETPDGVIVTESFEVPSTCAPQAAESPAPSARASLSPLGAGADDSPAG